MGKQHTAMSNRQAKRRFYQIATKAIEMGLLTIGERDTIRRHATRKRGNWARHLRNLCDYLDWKRDEGNGHCDTKRGSHIRQDATKRNSTR
ncbi:unnamed protein product [marine sediment metagenome]|uniref:Uncharacterized protein n=1 Tax=marine sediment metagenome TaxID=412755 RepID=X1PWF0_9ZZZZ